MRQLCAGNYLRKLSLAVAGLVATFHLWADDGRKKPSDVPMTRPEELLASLDGIGSEAAFVELIDGSIMIARGRGRFSVSKDGGLTWSPPQEARDADGNLLDGSDHNLIHLAGKGLGYVARPRTPPGGPPASYLVFYRSEDEGKTWQKPIRISEPSPFDEAAMNDVIVKTSSGRIILPVYAYLYSRSLTPSTTSCCFGLRKNQWISTGSHHSDPGFFWSYVYYSDDDGRSWKRSRSSEIYIWDPDAMTWSVAGEPTIVEVEPGKLLMLMRTMMGRLYKSWSFDNGETWSRAVSTALAASGAPAQVRKIPSTGDLLVVWTQHSAEEMRRGLIRARLSSAISRTNGALWEFFQNVESIVGGAWVEAGPIRFVRPAGLMGASPLDPDPVRAPEEMVDIPASYTRCSYPSVFIYKDRVLIGHSNAYYDEKGEWKIPGRLKVLPLSWLYDGKENMKPTPELKKEYPLEAPRAR